MKTRKPQLSFTIPQLSLMGVKNFLYKILDILLPPTSFEENLKKLGVDEFLRKSGGLRAQEYNKITYLLSYKNTFVRKCIWTLKYKNNSTVAILYAHVLNDYLLDLVSENSGFDFEDKFVLVPIPISKKHLSKRLNNQCELILKNLNNISGEGFDFNYADLIKTKNTKSQTKTSNKKERENNVIDSFDVKDSHSFLDRKIVLIDDVVTTGSTLHEAMRVLEEAGAKEIIPVAIAH